MLVERQAGIRTPIAVWVSCRANEIAPGSMFIILFLPQSILWDIPSLFGNPVARSETDQWLCELVIL